jgi:hypothetical protein
MATPVGSTHCRSGLCFVVVSVFILPEGAQFPHQTINITGGSHILTYWMSVVSTTIFMSSGKQETRWFTWTYCVQENLYLCTKSEHHLAPKGQYQLHSSSMQELPAMLIVWMGKLITLKKAFRQNGYSKYIICALY